MLLIQCQHAVIFFINIKILDESLPQKILETSADKTNHRMCRDRSNIYTYIYMLNKIICINNLYMKKNLKSVPSLVILTNKALIINMDS